MLFRSAYVDHLFGYINVKNLTPLKLVINSGNGAAGPVVDAIEARFKALGAPVELIKVHNTPDGNFPNGIPNPLLPAVPLHHHTPPAAAKDSSSAPARPNSFQRHQTGEPSVQYSLVLKYL